MNSLKKAALTTFLTQVLIFVCGFASSIILARVLGPAGRGTYALIILIFSVLGLVGSLGMDFATAYFSANRRYKLSDVISNSLISGLGLGLIFIFLFWGIFTTNVFQDFLTASNIPSLYLWFAVITLPTFLLKDSFKGILLGREEIVKFNRVRFFQSIFQLGLIVVLVVIFPYGLFGAVLAYSTTTIWVALVVTILVKKLAKINFSINIALLKESIWYGAKGYLGNIAQFLNYRVDIFLVAYFLNVGEVGLYTIAVGIAERLWMFPGALATVLFPRVSGIRDEQANQLTPKLSRHTLFILLVLSVGVLIFARPLIQHLFGTAFLPSVKPLLILLPGTVLLGFAKVLTSDLAGRGRPEFGTLAAFVSLAINLLLNIFLIPRWGICGAAFASSVAYTLATLVIIIAFSRLSKISWSNILLMKASDFMIYSEMCLRGMRRIHLGEVNKS